MLTGLQFTAFCFICLISSFAIHGSISVRLFAPSPPPMLTTRPLRTRVSWYRSRSRNQHELSVSRRKASNSTASLCTVGNLTCATAAIPCFRYRPGSTFVASRA